MSVTGEEERAEARSTADLVNAAKLTTLGMLVAGVAHELNTPMGALNSNHDTLERALRKLQVILADEVVEPDELEEVRRIVSAVAEVLRVNNLAIERMRHLVTSLRSFGRPDQAELDRVDIHDSLDATLTILAHEMRGIEVQREFGELPALECYPQQLGQVFMNLMMNAVQAMSGSGTLTVRTSMPADGVAIEIRDTGVGIPAEHLQRIFEPGFTTKNARMGMGLGLLITQQIIDRHGGRMAFTSEPGTGTSVTVSLPLRPNSTPPQDLGGTMRRIAPTILAALWLCSAAGLRAQNVNIQLAPSHIEHRLLEQPLEVSSVRGARPGPESRTQQVLLSYPADSLMLIKWAVAADGGAAFNNEPRYESAAYEIQKLFLDPIDFVVPPTVMRAVPLDWYRTYDSRARATFRGTESVVLLLQYWLFQITPDDFYQPDRIATDSLYARYFGNFNILTHLIHHRDENLGNFMISQYDAEPRVFAVDNGVAFRSDRSDRGYKWENIHVDRLPRATVDRLRGITREDLERTLAVIAEFEVRDRQLVAVPAGATLDHNRGVRQKDGRIQFGLTRREMDEVMTRIERLLQRIDEGRIEVF